MNRTEPAETAFFFGDEGDRRFAALHLPPQPRGLGVVICSPLAEERTVAFLVLRHTALHLAGLGYPVLRFDYWGTGDSDGESDQLTVRSGVADIRLASDELRRRAGVDRVALLGLRWGAALAVLAAEDDPQVAALCLWEPVVDPARYLQQHVRLHAAVETAGAGGRSGQEALRRLREGETVDVLGYPVGPALLAELDEVRLLESAARWRGPAQVVAINKSQRSRRDLEQLAAALSGELRSVADVSFWADPEDIVREVAAAQPHPELWSVTTEFLERSCA